MPRPSAATLSFLHQLQATASSGLLGISTYGGGGGAQTPRHLTLKESKDIVLFPPIFSQPASSVFSVSSNGSTSA